MKTNFSKICLTGLLLGAASWPARGAVSIFLHIDGVPGDSVVSGHNSDNDVTEFEFSAFTNAPGRPSFSLSIQKAVNAASPALALECASGGTYPTATLSCYKNTGSLATTAFYSITVTNVSVVGISTDATTSATPTESLSLQFTGVQWTYVPQNQSGGYGTPIVTSFPTAP
ncbi:MAG TPA: type VI secretion system tube protein Hcp [Verrucomicrobiae bacterium]|jgi:type VI secretion system secreted protein Hcp|nr:type VI secretion system tube protein Hcp [Verrucomicrobiae bacterium]